jgi:hypothetical protein
MMPWVYDSHARPCNVAALWTAEVDPTPADNLETGYSVGDEWVNTATSCVFRCFQSDHDQALWLATVIVIEPEPQPTNEPTANYGFVRGDA